MKMKGESKGELEISVGLGRIYIPAERLTEGLNGGAIYPLKLLVRHGENFEDDDDVSASRGCQFPPRGG